MGRQRLGHAEHLERPGLGARAGLAGRPLTGGRTAGASARGPAVPPFVPAPFRPAPWLPDPHLQTLAGAALRRPRLPRLHRVRLETPDGDFLDLDVDPGPAPPDVLVLHGLGGSSASGYVRQLLQELRSRGLRGAALNFRSCSGEPNRTRRFYHAGETGDPRLVIERLVALREGRPIGVAGFSLGGSALLRLLEESGEAIHGHVAAAVAVSVPFDLAAGARRLEALPGRLYGASFLSGLRAAVERKARERSLDLPLEAARRARTLREFDDGVTAPIHGFDGADDYYRSASTGQALDRIRTPTLVLHALDDPFLPEAAVPRATLAANPWISPVLTPRGGHVGFVEGAAPWTAGFWAERAAADFMYRVLVTS